MGKLAEPEEARHVDVDERSELQNGIKLTSSSLEVLKQERASGAETGALSASSCRLWGGRRPPHATAQEKACAAWRSSGTAPPSRPTPTSGTAELRRPRPARPDCSCNC